jgi:hypothetical protein
MSRISTISLEYKSNLEEARAEWDAFVAHVEQTQPTINGIPIAQSMPEQAQKTATTFGGLQSVAADASQYVPPFMQQQFPAQANTQQPNVTTAPRPFPGTSFFGTPPGVDSPAPPGPRIPSFLSRGDSFGGTPLGISGIVPQNLTQPTATLRPTEVTLSRTDPATKALEATAQTPEKSQGIPAIRTPTIFTTPPDQEGPRRPTLYEQTRASHDPTIEAGQIGPRLPQGEFYRRQAAYENLTGASEYAKETRDTSDAENTEKQKQLDLLSRKTGLLQTDVAAVAAVTEADQQQGRQQRQTGGSAPRGATGAPGAAPSPSDEPERASVTRAPGRIAAFGEETNAYLSSGEATPEHEQFAQRILERRLAGEEETPGGGAGGRPALRRGLGLEGLRGLGRYVGAFGIIHEATAALNQQNQYAIGLGGARTSQDLIQNEVAYQSNSPLASLPFIGPLGSALRENETRDQAYIANIGSAAQASDETFNIRQQRAVNRLGVQAHVSEAGGDFSGQRRAIELRSESQISSTVPGITAESTRLSLVKNAQDERAKQLRGELENFGLGYGLVPDVTQKQREADPLYQSKKTELSSVQTNSDALKTQMDALGKSAADFIKGVGDTAAADKESVGRASKAFLTGSQSRIKALGQQFTDTRGAEVTTLTGEYATLAAGQKPGSVEQQQTFRERDAAVRAQSQQFYRADYFSGRETQVGAAELTARRLGNQNFEYTARYAGVNAQGAAAQIQFEKQTAGVNPQSAEYASAFVKFIQALSGLASDAQKIGRDFAEAGRSISVGTLSRQASLSNSPLAAANIATNSQFEAAVYAHPELRPQLQAARNVDTEANQQEDQLRRFGIKEGTERIEQSTEQQFLRNRLLNRTADVQGIISSSANQIKETNVEFRGAAFAPERQRRVAAIRAGAAAEISGVTSPISAYREVEVVGAFVSGASRGSREAEDLRESRAKSAGLKKALDDANNEPIPIRSGGGPFGGGFGAIASADAEARAARRAPGPFGSIPPANSILGGAAKSADASKPAATGANAGPTQEQIQQLISRFDQAITILQNL